MKTQIVINMPEFNWLKKEEGFYDNSELIVGEKGGIKYGKNSYFVDKEWFDKVIERRSFEIYNELYEQEVDSKRSTLFP